MEQAQETIMTQGQACSPSEAPNPAANGRVAADLASLQSGYTLAQIHFTSHRTVLGPVVIALKKVLRRLLTPILECQLAYNGANARLASYLCEQVEMLKSQQMEAVQTLHVELAKQVEAVQVLRTELARQLQEFAPQLPPRGVDPSPQSVKTHYETGWDTYAESWESSVRKVGMQYLGDEWGSSDLTNAIIHQYVKPHLQADAIVLEIGCGSGKFSEKLASLCKLLICSDVSEKMLERAKHRLQGMTNIHFEKLNGLDLHQWASESVNFVFAFDCFVHIEIEDTYCYLQEIKRVLTPGGVGLLHFANLNSEGGWNKFTTEAPINRGNQKHFDRFCFLTWEIVEKFFNSLDLKIVDSQREPWRDILVVFEK
jgi:ubiquinone/menaquinone biosynthesis C-methylase UbiE